VCATRLASSRPTCFDRPGLEGDDARQHDSTTINLHADAIYAAPVGHVVSLGTLSQCRPPTIRLDNVFVSRYLFPETGSEGDGTRLVSDQDPGGDKTRKHAGAGQAQG
jgi:hypothetical protein